MEKKIENLQNEHLVNFTEDDVDVIRKKTNLNLPKRNILFHVDSEGNYTPVKFLEDGTLVKIDLDGDS